MKILIINKHFENCFIGDLNNYIPNYYCCFYETSNTAGKNDSYLLNMNIATLPFLFVTNGDIVTDMIALELRKLLKWPIPVRGY